MTRLLALDRAPPPFHASAAAPGDEPLGGRATDPIGRRAGPVPDVVAPPLPSKVQP